MKEESGFRLGKHGGSDAMQLRHEGKGKEGGRHERHGMSCVACLCSASLHCQAAHRSRS